MNEYFKYSVLQYKHSLALGEILNVGILFYFPSDNSLEFVEGGHTRVKSVYPNFNTSLFQNYLKSILNRIKNKVDLFSVSASQVDFSLFIHNNILAQDASGLIFREPVIVKNVFNSKDIVISEYSKLLLPGINIEKPNVIKHNEQFIIKQFSGYLSSKSDKILERLKKNESIKLKSATVKFDYVWADNFVKPVSFDLSDLNSIQNKSALIHSQLIQLHDYAVKRKIRFDLLIAKPQEPDLFLEYENALDLIDSVKTNKKIITQDNWQKYFQTTIDYLS
ncbi:MAG: DUF3037 domain-containing protein [Prolixibacteraceae bacterium]|nr:DUF3037 domain-containing protein [Prolixibacteraceae bacterium]